MELIRNFDKISKNDAGIAGGKGASLGEMSQAGLPVPPGFVILSGCFEQFLKETDLYQEIDSILHKVNHKEIHTVEGASEQIRELILNAEMPKDISVDIQKKFKKLDAKYVAVRSSATAEDGKDHAWAGQLESYLNTREAEVLAKVKLCWSSLFTPRAIFYRFEKGLHSTKISVAVVIQKMVESEFSGIAFSVHPVTEDYNQLIIEAGFGLGEAIVSGSVTPDSYVVEKEPRNILDINVSTQDRALYRSEKSLAEHGNNEWRDISEPQASSQVLTTEQILELSEIILKIENHYGFPCDIEWAFEKGKFYITQSRPITTLSSNKSLKKKILAEKFIEEIGNQELRPPIYNSSMLVHQSGWNTSKYFGKYYKSQIPSPLFFHTKGSSGVLYASTGKEKDLVSEVFREYWKNESYIHNRYDIFKDLTKKIDDIFFKKLTYSNLSRLAEKQINSIVTELDEVTWSMNAVAFYSIYFDKKICEELVQELGIGISQERLDFIWEKAIVAPGISFEKRRNLYLLELIDQGKSWSEIGELCQYFDTGYDKIFSPTVIEEKLREKYSSYTPQKASSEINLEDLQTEKRLKENKKWLDSLSDSERRIAHFTQFIIELRDERKDFIMKAVTGFYKIAERLFKDAGIQEEFMVFTSIQELKNGTQYLKKHKEEIISRAEKGVVLLVHYNNEQELEYGTVEENEKCVNEFFRSQQVHDLKSNELQGQRGSFGTVKGIARIIKDLYVDRGRLNPGEILVTGMTRPEFVPLMKIAGGIVTDEGGITCHAAIVSRELGIPCVIGTKIATQVLKDGDMVEMDADNGIVKIIK
ncbi:MAG: PEP/pyruvate-binding domain-containing protein [Patescibacteria group bacterium]